MAKNNKYMKYKKKKNFIKPTDTQMENWLKKNGIEYKSFDTQFRVCNPDGDVKYNMAISKTEALVHDFRPNHQQFDGSFLGFVAKYKEISFREAIDEVCGKDHKIVSEKPQVEEDEIIEDEIELPKGSLPLRDKKDTKIWKMSMNYLVNKRGLDVKTIFRANIHYLGTTIVVPYYEYGMIVFYQSRQQVDKKFEFPKSSKKSAGDFLYGFDDVEPYSEVIVVESIFNALSVGPGCVATGGAKLKDGQIELLKILSPSEIVLAADNDDAGRVAVVKDYMKLNKIFKCPIYYCLPPFNKNEDEQEDWNDMKKNKIDVRKYITDNKIKMTMMNAFQGINGREFKI